MRLKKNLPAILLLVVLLFDAVVAYRLVDQGWPKYLKGTSGDGFQVMRLPFTWGDGLIVIALAGLHVFLIYRVRRSRVSAPLRH